MDSVLKRNHVSSHEKTWKNFKYALLSERSQSEKAAYSMIPTIFYKNKNIEALKRSMVDRR